MEDALSTQQVAVVFFLVAAGAATLVFGAVLRGATTRRAVDPGFFARLRVRFALVLALLLGGALGLTLPRMPYPAQDEVPDQVVFVAAKQFAFGLSETPITSDQQWEAASQGPVLKLRAGTLVEFRVASLDVNHGFGVYGADGRLIAQTQAMPGYVNRLRMRLGQPGRYPVLCLELCGMEHHSMRGVFEVIP